MSPERPLQLLRFALASGDLRLALALVRRLRPVAHAHLRRMARLPYNAADRRPLLGIALELLAAR